MDGVLVDSYRAHLRSWQETARAHGLVMTEEDFARSFGRTSREIIRHLWGDRFDAAAVAAFDEEKEAAYRRVLRTSFPEMPGASALIRDLQAAGFALAIGSSGPPANVALVQECLAAGALIDATVSGMEVTHGKPDPDVFLLAARKIAVPPARCAVIEDAPVGLEAARRAGMVAIGLTGTVPREKLAEKAAVVVDSLSQLSAQRIAEWIDAARGAPPID